MCSKQPTTSASVKMIRRKENVKENYLGEVGSFSTSTGEAKEHKNKFILNPVSS